MRRDPMNQERRAGMTKNDLPSWLWPVADALATQGANGLFLIVFPEYRPDLTKSLAHHLGLAYFDFRAEVMSRLGTGAPSLGLDALERSLAAHAEHRGVVVMNAEALLAAKAPADRQAWLRSATGLSFPHPVCVSLSLFGDDAAAADPRVLRLEAAGLPEQSFLSRLAN
jgi:hypothetical protein